MKYVMLGKQSDEWLTRHDERKRLALAKADELGITFQSILYTQGSYDFVDVADAPTPEAMLNSRLVCEAGFRLVPKICRRSTMRPWRGRRSRIANAPNSDRIPGNSKYQEWTGLARPTPVRGGRGGAASELAAVDGKSPTPARRGIATFRPSGPPAGAGGVGDSHHGVENGSTPRRRPAPRRRFRRAAGPAPRRSRLHR